MHVYQMIIDYSDSNRRSLIPDQIHVIDQIWVSMFITVGLIVESLSIAEYRRLFHISHLLESKKKRKKTKKRTRGGKQKHKHTTKGGRTPNQRECGGGNSNWCDEYKYGYDYESVFDLFKHLKQFDSAIVLFDDEMIENYLQYYFFNYKRRKVYGKRHQKNHDN